MRKQSKWVLLLLFMMLNSCAMQFQKPVTEENVVIFPPPPDTTRIQYLTSISNSIDITGKRSGLLRYIMGEEKGKEIMKPYGIAISKGKLYICDSLLGGLEIIDLKHRTFDYFRPMGRGQVKKPINCFIDDDGYLYIADVKRRQIVIFDENRHYVRACGDATKIKPTDVFVHDDKIWVTDINNHKLLAFAKDTGKLEYSIPGEDSPQSKVLYSPTNLYIANDHIYVSDIGDSKIKVFSMDGSLLQFIGSYGRMVGQFVRPKGVAVDSTDRIYVVDAGFENIQIFNNDGALLMFFGGSYKGPGYMWLPAKVIIDYDNLDYFQKYVENAFNLQYLIFVSNQYGPNKISVYGFVEPKEEMSN